DDLRAYRAVCAGMLERFAKTTDPVVAAHVVNACVAAPDAVADPGQLIPLAQLACSTNRTANVGLLGAAFYRSGHPDRALECFSEMPRTPPRAWHRLFEAMTHVRLGAAEEARRCLGYAEKWLAIVGPPGPDDATKPIPRWYNWQDELVVRLLRCEA